MRTTPALGALLVGAGHAVAMPLLGGSWWPVAVSPLVGGGLGPAFTAMPALIASATPWLQLSGTDDVRSRGGTAVTETIAVSCSCREACEPVAAP